MLYFSAKSAVQHLYQILSRAGTVVFIVFVLITEKIGLLTRMARETGPVRKLANTMDHRAWTLMESSNPTGMRYVKI